MTADESTAFSQSQATLACGYQALLYRVDMTLGERIQKARERRGLTQAEVGAHFGISSQAVNQWEISPKKGPRRDRMPELARLLDVPLDWLTGGTGDPPPANELVQLINSLPPAIQKRAIRIIRAMADEEAA